MYKMPAIERSVADRSIVKDLENVDLSLLPVPEGRNEDEMIEFLANFCQDKIFKDPEWGILAGRFVSRFIRMSVPPTFSQATEKMKPILNSSYYDFVMENAKKLDEIIDPTADDNFDLFAIRTLMKSYLAHLKTEGSSILVETPQYMYLRIATFLHYPSLENIKKVYTSLSRGYYSHATPTMFNSGLLRHQLSSCFLQHVDDNMQAISKAWHDQAIISMNSGGIGSNYTNIRHSEIGQHGFSRGIVPWLKITNEILKTVDQCFSPDTFVFSDKGPAEISKINIGDKILCSNGSFIEVQDTKHYPLSDEVVLHSVTIENGFEETIVAGCHPFLAIRTLEKDPNVVIKNIDEGNIVPEYIDAENINNEFLIATTCPSIRISSTSFNYDLEDCYFYGILLASGFWNETRSFISITMDYLDRKFDETILFIKDYLHKRGVSKLQIVSDKNMKTLLFENNPKTIKFTRNWVYDENDEKRVFPLVFNFSSFQIKKIIEGFLDSVISPEKYLFKKTISISFSPESRKLYTGLRQIFSMIGVYPFFHRNNTAFKTKKENTSTMYIADSNFYNPIIWNGKLWSRVVSNKIVGKNDRKNTRYIVDLEMKTEDESKKNYVTSCGIAHNGGKRKGSGAIYLRDCHVDVFEFIELRDEGPEDLRAKDLFLGLMISDLFMRRVRADEKWSLFCPNRVRGIMDVYGKEFEKLYEEAENDGLASHTVRARDLWQLILTMQIKKGVPYILYMDACNRKSNQKHSGIIRCSNLCSEILEVTSSKELASCTLASICLSKCVEFSNGKPYFDFSLLKNSVQDVVVNLNQVIDRNYYPEDIPEIKYSNFRHRPLGIGVQGLADALAMLDISWVEKDEEGKLVASKEAIDLNYQISEVMYYSAIEKSMELARIDGYYPSFPSSPLSSGKFQEDLWREERELLGKPPLPPRKSFYTEEYKTNLRKSVMRYGVRNSLLIAIMPTASSAQILGNNEAAEPFTDLIQSRTVLSGQYTIVNKHLVKDLRKISLWNSDVVKTIISSGFSSVVPPPNFPENLAKRLEYLKMKYLTVFEIPQKATVTLAIDRGLFVCQTQSMNCFMARPTRSKLNAYHFFCWENGLKTGMYYLRQKAMTNPINIAIDHLSVSKKRKDDEKENSNKKVCTEDVCTMCTS